MVMGEIEKYCSECNKKFDSFGSDVCYYCLSKDYRAGKRTKDGHLKDKPAHKKWGYTAPDN